jgi:hypothetical protein
MSNLGVANRRGHAAPAGALFAVLFLFAGASQGAESPNVQEIQARLEKQRAAVRSIFVEVRDYTTISVEPDVLLSWTDYKNLLGLVDERHDFAFKGPKRYLRSERLNPLKLLRPRKIRVQPDETRADNGRDSWRRPVDDEKGGPGLVFTLTVFRSSRDEQWVQTPAYFSNIGWQNTDRDSQDKWVKAMRENDLVDMLKQHAIKVAPQPVKLDGTNCLLLEGDTERTIPLPAGPETVKSHQTIWLDLDHGLAVRQHERRSKRGFGRIVNSDFVEIQPGLWFPKKSAWQRFAPPDAPMQYQGRPVFVLHSDLIRWEVNSVPDDLFDPVTKPGDRVNDHRAQARQ